MLFKLFKKKTRGNPYGRVFSDEDRQKAAQTRKENQMFDKQMKLLERQLDFKQKMAQMNLMKEQLSMYDDNDDDDDFSNEDNGNNEILMSIAAPLLAKLSNATPQNTTPAASGVDISSHYVDLNDNEIQQMIQQLPKTYLKAAKKMDDVTIGKIIKSKLPALSDATIQRAIQMVKQ